MSLVISWGAVTTLVTAFDLTTLPNGQIFWSSVLFSGVFTIVMTFRPRKWLPAVLGIGTFLAVYLFARRQDASLLSSVETVLYRISLAFNRTYYWGVLHWSPTPPTAAPDLALLLVSCGISLVVSAIVCLRLRVSGAVLLALLPLILSMIAKDTIPDSRCLWLLFTGLGLLILTGSPRRMNPEAARRFTAMILVPTLLATTLLFGIIPPSGYTASGLSGEIVTWIQSLPIWSASSQSGNYFTGDIATAEVDLSDLGQRMDSPSVAMTVFTTHSGRLYLRGRSYDQYDGKTWTATVDSSGKDPGWAGPKEEYLYAVTITMEKPRDLLYFPGVAGVDLQGKSFMKGYLPNHGDLLEYTFNYGVSQEHTSGMNDPVWLALPTATRLSAAKLLSSILQNVDPDDTAAKAAAIEAYVESCAEYSYVPSRMPETEPDFAMWFLEDAEYGYCMHYATAAAVLLRAAGIPARYATGYCLDVVSRQRTDVWERYAHAWVEYFLPGTGWTILDATKGSPEPDPLPTDPPETTAPPATSVPTKPPVETSPGVTQDATLPTETTVNPQIPTQNATRPAVQAPTGGTPDWVKAAISWLLIIAGAIVLLIGQYRLRIWAKRRFLSKGNSNCQALSRYRLIRLRSRLLRKPIPERMTELAEKAKYSSHKLTRTELREMDHCLASLAREMTRNSPILCFLFAIQ